MLSFLWYELPSGPRSLVLVEDPGAEHPFSVLDIPADDPLREDADWRVVGHELDDDVRAREVAQDYVAALHLPRPPGGRGART
jgi:hypothetical protein